MMGNVTTEMVLLLVHLSAFPMDRYSSVLLMAYLEGSRLDCTSVWMTPGPVWVPMREHLPCSHGLLARMLQLSGVGG